MSDDQSAPLEQTDRAVTEDGADTEAPSDAAGTGSPQSDADQPVPELADGFQEENASTSLDQPSDQSS